MKIAINGDIIDTKDIYKISKIKYDPDYNKSQKIFYFDIQFFNKQQSFYLSTENNRKLTIRDLHGIRNSIIKIWSENQSKIPQFNI